MSLKEIFIKPPYDPVHAHVPGVDEVYTRQLREEFINGGDPTPRPKPPREKTLLKINEYFYIKIVEKPKSRSR